MVLDEVDKVISETVAPSLYQRTAGGHCHLLPARRKEKWRGLCDYHMLLQEDRQCVANSRNVISLFSDRLEQGSSTPSRLSATAFGDLWARKQGFP